MFETYHNFRSDPKAAQFIELLKCYDEFVSGFFWVCVCVVTQWFSPLLSIFNLNMNVGLTTSAFMGGKSFQLHGSKACKLAAKPQRYSPLPKQPFMLPYSNPALIAPS